MAKKILGRPPRWKDIKKAHELKKAGLSIREIALVVLKREDKRTIQRWITNYPWAKVINRTA